MKLNTALRVAPARTHEGAIAARLTDKQQLERAVSACLLWEDGFYEDGKTVADRIKELAHKVSPEDVSALAAKARTDLNLRHAPLLLARELCRHPKLTDENRPLVSETIEWVIRRADELAEFVSIYWKDGKQSLSAQAKKGLAKSFLKFDEYQLAKYNRDGAIKLRDVLFMCHAKPDTKAREKLWKRLVDGELTTPDTWEVTLSSGADKLTAWTRLIDENKLGALAFLRNLCNMGQAGVSERKIKDALATLDVSKVLPFRFIAAARAAVGFEKELETLMFRSLEGSEKLAGKTIVLVDVSGSMDAELSAKSDLTRIDAACALAAVLREICEECTVLSFSNALTRIPDRRGFSMIDAIKNSQPHHGTYIGASVNTAFTHHGEATRTVVITDEQSHDAVPGPGERAGYMINVATNQNGVGFGDWVRISGFSESVVRFIQNLEAPIWE